MAASPGDYEQAVKELYPSEATPTGGVRASMVAERVGKSRRHTRSVLVELAEEGRLRKLGGLRGPTYAPEERDA